MGSWFSDQGSNPHPCIGNVESYHWATWGVPHLHFFPLHMILCLLDVFQVATMFFLWCNTSENVVVCILKLELVLFLKLTTTLEKRSWKSSFGVMCYAPSLCSCIKSFHFVLISVGPTQERKKKPAYY